MLNKQNRINRFGELMLPQDLGRSREPPGEWWAGRKPQAQKSRSEPLLRSWGGRGAKPLGEALLPQLSRDCLWSQCQTPERTQSSVTGGWTRCRWKVSFWEMLLKAMSPCEPLTWAVVVILGDFCGENQPGRDGKASQMLGFEAAGPGQGLRLPS